MPGERRHRKVLRDNIQGITKPAIRRLARRGGVKRLSGLIYEETRSRLKVFLENVIRDTVTFTEHARRKTVGPLDVVRALKLQGRPMYGFGADVPGGGGSIPKGRSPKGRSPKGRSPKRPVNVAAPADVVAATDLLTALGSDRTRWAGLKVEVDSLTNHEMKLTLTGNGRSLHATLANGEEVYEGGGLVGKALPSGFAADGNVNDVDEVVDKYKETAGFDVVSTLLGGLAEIAPVALGTGHPGAVVMPVMPGIGKSNVDTADRMKRMVDLVSGLADQNVLYFDLKLEHVRMVDGQPALIDIAELYSMPRLMALAMHAMAMPAAIDFMNNLDPALHSQKQLQMSTRTFKAVAPATGDPESALDIVVTYWPARMVKKNYTQLRFRKPVGHGHVIGILEPASPGDMNEGLEQIRDLHGILTAWAWYFVLVAMEMGEPKFTSWFTRGKNVGMKLGLSSANPLAGQPGPVYKEANVWFEKAKQLAKDSKFLQ